MPGVGVPSNHSDVQMCGKGHLWEEALWGQLPWNAGEAYLPLRTAALL